MMSLLRCKALFGLHHNGIAVHMERYIHLALASINYTQWKLTTLSSNNREHTLVMCQPDSCKTLLGLHHNDVIVFTYRSCSIGRRVQRSLLQLCCE